MMFKHISLFPHAPCVALGFAIARRLLHGGLVKIHPEVSEAITNKKAVVALESTIITHGMPRPHNLNTAKEVEQIVKEHGVVPATVGVVKGKIHVGLSNNDLQYLAETKKVLKASRRDLPYILSKGLSGGTTVSATMMIAHKVGIPLLVTGGIGGVHRDGQNTLDISTDLTELGRNPVTVISAGVKSILDIGRTLEYLETLGVCVATFGKSRDFPAFFIPKSGFQSPYNVTDEEEAAQLIANAHKFGQDSSVLIAVPIPEEQAASSLIIDDAIQQALEEARDKGILGKDVTPFVLNRIYELTKGISLTTNIALIKNNAKVGSRIACALTRQSYRKFSTLSQPPRAKHGALAQPVVIGGCNVDFIAKAKQGNLVFNGFTNNGTVQQSTGGVGRNLADCLSRLGLNPLFISAIGKDANGDAVLRFCSHMDTSAVVMLPGHSTAVYCAVITANGELSLGLGDMDIHCQITEQYVSKFKEQLQSASLVCLDGNIPTSTINYVCSLAEEHGIPVLFEPTNSISACKPFKSDSWKSLAYTSPNLMELRSMNEVLGLPVPAELPSVMDDVIGVALDMSRPLLKHLKCVIVTLGQQGVILCGKSEEGTISLQPKKAPKIVPGKICAIHYPAIAVETEEIVNVSGAGDSLAAGIIAGILTGQETHTCIRMGLLAASYSLRSQEAISTLINTDSVNPQQVIDRVWQQPTYHCENKPPTANNNSPDI
ncbi:pseudouridine-metabolizing bifunctional protein C1861.05 [Carcharodon carcharias]|uniref:pseudouridine-metabolizing bifunctional protein C1861.05 n=1 Tax=Carcharodon carcharias TaxID=13397 RepID=UPI001B7E50DD|nr:pseudouridine-metabolizing bifunctional protein C1861.05 [Carcharodon carcharias]